MGIGVPEDPRKRAELAGIAFLCRLWMGSSDFSLDDERLEAAIDEIEAGADVDEGEIEVIVPLRGLQMPVARLDLDVRLDRPRRHRRRAARGALRRRARRSRPGSPPSSPSSVSTSRRSTPTARPPTPGSPRSRPSAA